MVAIGIRAALLLATAAGVATPDGTALQSDAWQTRLANGGVQSATTDGAITATIAQWQALRQTDALPFDSYANFLLAHPGWPGETANRSAAERQAATAQPANVVRFFNRFPPLSGAGAAARARALLAMGQPVQAADAARDAWRRASLSPTDESYVLGMFAGQITPADHDARMDALLWAGNTSGAARQLAYVSPARRAGFAARLSFRSNAPDAASLATAEPGALAGDPGYIADRANWLRNNGASPTSRSFLSQPRRLTGLPGNPEKWFETLLTAARGAANDGQYQLAYDIARQIDDAYSPATDVSVKPYGERDDYTSLAWLGGQTALKKLNRPADAMTLFDRYARGSRAPQTRAKGFYWAGRAAEAAGRSVEATAFFATAAGYRDQFYGQLAAERSGRTLAAPPPIVNPTIAPAVRAAYDGREVVRAARFLGQIGQWQDQTALIRQIAADATTDNDHLLGAELSRSLNRPDLAVMIGRSALQNGLSDYSAAGFPTVPVPVGYEGSWTLIHAIARQESQFDRAAISHAGARGLMQLMPGTAREQAGKLGLSYDPAALTTDPSLSMMLGSSYFQRVYAGFGSYPLAIAAYNAGPGNVRKWLAANGDPRMPGTDVVDWVEAIPLSETRNYVQRVLENAVVYDLINPTRSLSTGRPAPLSWYLGKNRPG
ncbi:soluble lytic murein transglycosylase [Sphingomonas gellani]|uniref:Soluble lytic murein transglycosylase n=1 Tax=Sphingomonas gellani TaxID=1166340 RepID=A0A1H7ZTU7_9SPHN|nr:lytic transglycosylase domain-containing protein [Sphingomonas gellani]SEM61855.1 soluble lytic murein transglycosylase [Sphingomonas gellani]